MKRISRLASDQLLGVQTPPRAKRSFDRERANCLARERDLKAAVMSRVKRGISEAGPRKFAKQIICGQIPPRAKRSFGRERANCLARERDLKAAAMSRVKRGISEAGPRKFAKQIICGQIPPRAKRSFDRERNKFQTTILFISGLRRVAIS